jgi:PTS system nitrogen regulatory IIA component
MTRSDFDIESLARHLRMDRAVVARLAERGKLPGRRVGGQWRFARADIHLWWEERIRSGSGDELASFEAVLGEAGLGEPVDDASEPLRSIAEILPPEGVRVPLAARTRNSVLTSLVQLASDTGLLWDADKMEAAVRTREASDSTALDNGVALLHPPRPIPGILAQPLLVLARTHQGLPFGHPRGCLTDIFLLICSVDERSHLWVLARLARLINDPAVLQGLRSAEDGAEARQGLLDAEAALTAPLA